MVAGWPRPENSLYSANKLYSRCIYIYSYGVVTVVGPDFIPNEVASSFVDRYSNSSVDIWFNQDENGYTAAFVQNDINMFAMFDTDGSFIKEYSKEERDDYYSNDNHKDKKHHKKGKHKGKKDHKKKKASCICEVEDENEIEEVD